MTAERWTRLMRALGIAPNIETFNALAAAYGERHRHYHNADHLDACLRLVDEARGQAIHPDDLELALWFHDAVYRPLSSGNEQRSADWAADFLRANAAPAERIDRVRDLILATKHDTPPRTEDEALIVDIDLAILGADVAGYDAFEQGVRAEYRMVPGPLFRKKRAEVLRHFLGRGRLYHHEPFASRFEERARANLAHAIARLTGPH